MRSNICREFINNIPTIDNAQYVVLKNKILEIGNKDPIGLILETHIDELKCSYCYSEKKQR